MKRLLLATLACLLFVSFSHAQCNITTSSNYSSSVTFGGMVNMVTKQWHGIVTVVTAGSSDMEMDSNCPCSGCITQFNNNKQNIQHGFTNTNKLNGVDGSSSAQLCAECWSTLQTTVDSGWLPASSPTTAGTVGSTVYCPYAGANVWNWLNLNDDIELAITMAKDNNAPGIDDGRGGTIFTVSYYCSSASSPPDWEPGYVDASQGVGRHSYWIGITACGRLFGSPWLCAATMSGYLVVNRPWTQILAPAVPWYQMSYDCTNADAGFSGFGPLSGSWPW